MAKAAHPFRFWVAGTALDTLQEIVYWPWNSINSIRYYFNNRWVSQSHAMVAYPKHVRRGQWCDITGRMLPCMFDTLQDFVEIECAVMHVACDKKAAEKYHRPFWHRGLFRFSTWRCPAAGLDYLNWASKLVFDENWGISPGNKLYGKLTPQAQGAIEILFLYKWWTETYANRVDPMDASGWSAYCDKEREKNDGDLLAALDISSNAAERKESRQLGKILKKLEAEQEKEDTEMMCRLVKVRHNLWT